MRHFIVVYQYGKVASTSLTTTLNALPEVEAVQAHFLGYDTLREMVELIVDPATSDYFHRHQVGQFIENARTTRVVNAFRQGHERNRALSIISLHRDPFEWFRSSILQDMAGYLPALRAIPLGGEVESGGEVEPGDEDARTRRALERTLGAFSGIVDQFGGIDALLEQSAARKKALAEHPVFAENRDLLAMFYMMFRPFSWFEAHYRRAIGYGIDELAEIEKAVLHRNVGWASLFVLRYDDLEDQFQVAAERLGIGPVDALAQENASGGKTMHEPVHDAFASKPARALQAQFAATAYARRFGYD